MEKKETCKFYNKTNRGYCNHKYNKDIRSRKKYKSHPKRCEKNFCPYGEKYYDDLIKLQEEKNE